MIFLETGQHFLQTLQYLRALTERLGLTDADACCDLRKVQPLAMAAAGFDALITGRKRYQAETRRALSAFEVADDGRLRINPLARWTAEDVEDYAVSRDLPRHPLVEQGYASIGCWPCTAAVVPGADARSGRRSGVDKVECGIHLGRRLAPTG